MKQRVFGGILISLAFAAAVIAQNAVDGKWQGTIAGGRGNQEVTLNLKADGMKLTGTITGPQGESPIEDGKVDGSAVSFKQKISFNNNEIVLGYSGKVSGDEMTMTRQAEGGGGGGRGGRGGGPAEFTLKRVK